MSDGQINACSFILLEALNENGHLPPGIHPAPLDEVVARFGGGSQQRAAQAESLQWLVPMCRAAAIELRNGLPFLEIKIVTEEDFDFFAGTIFASDRDMIAKGMVEISL
jgi:hypothetical protein